MDRVSPSLDYSGFRRADLVIEAVFEDLELKRRVLARDRGRDPRRVRRSRPTPPRSPSARSRRAAAARRRSWACTSSRPCTRCRSSRSWSRPRPPPTAIATAAAFGRRIGKHVIVVRDGPGFYTSRALAAYMNEATWMLEEGAGVVELDRAMTSFGFPVGPLTLLDEVGIDVGAKVAKVMHHHFGERMSPPPSMEKLLADGRLGRKAKKGFYTYDGGKKRVDESVYALLPGGTARRPIDAREAQERLVLRVPERVRALPAGGDPALAARRRRGGDLRAGLPTLPGRAVPLPRPPRRPLRPREDGERCRRATAGASSPPRCSSTRPGRAAPSMQQDTDPLTRTAGRREARA